MSESTYVGDSGMESYHKSRTACIYIKLLRNWFHEGRKSFVECWSMLLEELISADLLFRACIYTPFLRTCKFAWSQANQEQVLDWDRFGANFWNPNPGLDQFWWSQAVMDHILYGLVISFFGRSPHPADECRPK